MLLSFNNLMNVSEILSKFILTELHVAEEFLKEELLKIQYSTCLKIVTEEDFYFLNILGITCLRPLGTNEINYLHLPHHPPLRQKGNGSVGSRGVHNMQWRKFTLTSSFLQRDASDGDCFCKLINTGPSLGIPRRSFHEHYCNGSQTVFRGTLWVLGVLQ